MVAFHFLYSFNQDHAMLSHLLWHMPGRSWTRQLVCHNNTCVPSHTWQLVEFLPKRERLLL